MRVKTKRCICSWTAALGVFLALGIGGNIEWSTMPLGKGAILMSLCIMVAALASYKAGWMS